MQPVAKSMVGIGDFGVGGVWAACLAIKIGVQNDGTGPGELRLMAPHEAEIVWNQALILVDSN